MGDTWAQFLAMAWISILTKTTHTLDCLKSWDHNPFFVSCIWRVSSAGQRLFESMRRACSTMGLLCWLQPLATAEMLSVENSDCIAFVGIIAIWKQIEAPVFSGLVFRCSRVCGTVQISDGMAAGEHCWVVNLQHVHRLGSRRSKQCCWTSFFYQGCAVTPYVIVNAQS